MEDSNFFFHHIFFDIYLISEVILYLGYLLRFINLIMNNAMCTYKLSLQDNQILFLIINNYLLLLT